MLQVEPVQYLQIRGTLMATDDEVFALQKRYDVTPVLAKLLYLMVVNDRVTTQDVEATGVVGDVRVSIHRLRKIMSEHGIEVRSAYRAGYWLSDEDRAKLKEVLDYLVGNEP